MLWNWRDRARQSEAERAEREDGAVRSGVGLGGNGKQWQAMDTVLQALGGTSRLKSNCTF